MKPTDGDLIQLQSQAEFMAMGFGTREWKLMAEAVKELRQRRAGEFICPQCQLRVDSKQPASVEF